MHYSSLGAYVSRHSLNLYIDGLSTDLVMNVKIILSLILASLILLSTIVVTIKPIQSASAQVPGLAGSNATTSGMSNAKVSGSSSVSPSASVKAAESNIPPALNPKQIQRLEEQVNETFGGYPKSVARAAAPGIAIKPPVPNTATTPSTASLSLDINGSNISRLGNMSNSTINTNSTTNSTNGVSSQNASQQLSGPNISPIITLKSTIVAPVNPRSIVDEPSLASKGPIVFYTGNWYAARSTDFGASWKFINPFSMADFCCDQDVVYDKNHQIFLWYKQGIASSTTGENRFELGVSKDALTWVFYDITPTGFNSAWKNQWFDYPHLALSNNNIWITSNMFNQAGQFQRTVISEWPLTPLSLGQTVNFRYYFETQEFNFTPVQGATDTMYWAVHHNNAQMKLYKWPETSSSISSKLVNVPAWTFGFRGNMICTSPDHLNWCARSDSRITGGWISNGIIGFLWNAGQGNGFPYPYVNIATFRQSDFGFLSNPKLWNQNIAYMFGFAHPSNLPGELGLVAIYGGGLFYPSIAAGTAVVGGSPPFNLVTIRSGDHAASKFGDYIRIRPLPQQNPLIAGQFWIGSGYTPQGCSDTNCAEPRFFAFGHH